MNSASDELEQLRAENARLRALLDAHGIDSRPPLPTPSIPLQAEPSRLNTDEKVALFRRLFQGRIDSFPIRWESKAGKSGYSPACANEWRPGVCEKPRIKCSDCGNRLLISLSDQTIYDHLAGRHTIGVYPLLPDDTCRFLAVDFDDADWQEDARAFRFSCLELGVPAALEISRSGNGAHVWIFFQSAVSARDARRLGTAIISQTCARTRQLQLASYDRLFPNQDTVPKGGFGNLIALPLQKIPRERGCSVFVDEEFQPYADQWAYLASLQLLAPDVIETAISTATGGAHPLDVTFIENEDQHEPWKSSKSGNRLSGPMPESLSVTLANLIYFEKRRLPQPLLNRLIRLAAFPNPEFYKAQKMRFPVWDKPRIIGCAENYPVHLALPRGCFDDARNLLRENNIRCDFEDARFEGEPLDVAFAGTLRPDQETAVTSMLGYDTGVLCAPTAFGKTVSAAAMIARRGVNTLILVHRTELLKQWQERLQSLLDVGKGVIGTIGGGKSKRSGKIDIAVMQSLTRKGELSELVEHYGHVIVDECHHVSAFSFEALLKRAKAKYVLGLTATPIRRDGQHPIIFMQCGPIRHTAVRATTAPHDLEVIPRFWSGETHLPVDAEIQDVFRQVANDASRTIAIADEVESAFSLGRKVLVLTERTDHIVAIEAALAQRIEKVFTLHGRMSKRQRKLVIAELDALDADAPRVLLATGKLVGEGFDHPPLDTLVLAMPISWRGTLQQYAGRLHREHATKVDVRIIDFVDTAHPALGRMWEKRQAGYRAMGYRVETRGRVRQLF
ncbi:DEAD/DEAH box helicase family protein [Paraburkholderia sp. C35]|uniref:TOTE conflict system archaeo-eukaryotic primase domain-containing protein n=1 Tax=Paraburkholderia sp. C35 TaxID=2126993 RepID=UPI000D687C94|nr:DEAD/DEAH box helicase family protein [Paraburkholderia sp. C35]